MNNFIKINKDFEDFINIFLEENKKINLISKNDTKFLFEKHIYDSLSIKLFFDKYGTNFKNLLDIGCGGGFPCLPIALEYPDLKIIGLDSIRKKIIAVETIKNKLNITNLDLICEQAENIKSIRFDIITSRAVANLSKISELAIPLLNKEGFFIAYKSKKAEEEIDSAQLTLKKYDAKIVDTIDYTLPTEEKHERKLIIIKKQIN